MRVRRAAMLIAAVALFVGGLSGTANAAPPDAQMQAVLATTGAAPAPPPPPVTTDGVQLQGSWIGPYTYRNLNSGRCLDILGASKDLGAPAVQYRCVAGGVSQMWYLWHTEGDGSIDFHLIGNAYSGKCLMAWNHDLKAPIKQIGCYTGTPEQVWITKSTELNIHLNDGTNLCMEVIGGSLADFAAIVQWTCHHRAHQVWLRYNA
ncbi:RICIN domain-containing protein [Actinomadura sp. ATCC 31491]|uniref:RICIN domain-containing protein n=1 Tax=Actinomadura luzonensis TaxID=2805427 RepID=A0ABT0G2W5_9ACTN|nr:RICIN domain-containing protein [Actinomadura luzonensis]MCK2218458.1 RICIN domain-containing protein [Actinomadura luzonensis]